MKKNSDEMWRQLRAKKKTTPRVSCKRRDYERARARVRVDALQARRLLRSPAARRDLLHQRYFLARIFAIEMQQNV